MVHVPSLPGTTRQQEIIEETFNVFCGAQQAMDEVSFTKFCECTRRARGSDASAVFFAVVQNVSHGMILSEFKECLALLVKVNGAKNGSQADTQTWGGHSVKTMMKPANQSCAGRKTSCEDQSPSKIPLTGHSLKLFNAQEQSPIQRNVALEDQRSKNSAQEHSGKSLKTMAHVEENFIGRRPSFDDQKPTHPHGIREALALLVQVSSTRDGTHTVKKELGANSFRAPKPAQLRVMKPAEKSSSGRKVSKESVDTTAETSSTMSGSSRRSSRSEDSTDRHPWRANSFKVPKPVQIKVMKAAEESSSSGRKGSPEDQKPEDLLDTSVETSSTVSGSSRTEELPSPPPSPCRRIRWCPVDLEER